MKNNKANKRTRPSSYGEKVSQHTALHYTSHDGYRSSRAAEKGAKTYTRGHQVDAFHGAHFEQQYSLTNDRCCIIPGTAVVAGALLLFLVDLRVTIVCG